MFEARQRERKSFHGLTVLPGVHPTIRVDSRTFLKFPKRLFDGRFVQLKGGTA